MSAQWDATSHGVVCFFFLDFPCRELPRGTKKSNEVLLVMPCCRGIRNQVGGRDLMGLLIGVDVFLGWVVFKKPLNP